MPDNLPNVSLHRPISKKINSFYFNWKLNFLWNWWNGSHFLPCPSRYNFLHTSSKLIFQCCHQPRCKSYQKFNLNESQKKLIVVVYFASQNLFLAWIYNSSPACSVYSSIPVTSGPNSRPYSHAFFPCWPSYCLHLIDRDPILLRGCSA